VSGDDSFERDLRRWVHHFYLQREELVAERARLAVESLFDRERHFLTWLAAQLLLGIALIPWSGVWSVLGGLIILYAGTLISGAWMLNRERRLARRKSRGAIEQEAERAFASRPALDPDARALLIRLMNLAALRPTPRSLELLRQELRETLAVPALLHWRFLHEVLELLQAQDGARLGALQPLPVDFVHPATR
jgi:hypothetical protein